MDSSNRSVVSAVPASGAGSSHGPAGTSSPTEPQLAPRDWSTLRTTVGLRLHGEYQDSGFSQPRYLAQRGDGQVVQLTLLLYLVLAAVHTGGDLAGIASRVSAQYGRALSAANLAYLLTTKLLPLGLVAVDADEDLPDAAPRLSPLLAVKGNRVLIPERVVGRLARGLAWMCRGRRCAGRVHRVRWVAVRDPRRDRPAGARGRSARLAPRRDRAVADRDGVPRARARRGVPLRRRQAGARSGMGCT